MRSLFLFFAFWVTISVQAQLSENFSGVSLSPYNNTITTIKVGGMPTGWTESPKHNNGLYLPAFGYFTGHGWITKEFQLTPSSPVDTVACSLSFYINDVPANNWLITKPIQTPTVSGSEKVYLSWDAMSESEFDPEAYDVRISTTSATDTSAFTTVLYSTTNEPAVQFNTHSVDISAYQGQQIYIAFKHKSTGFLLLIDDVNVKKVSGIDANLTQLYINRYAKTSTNIDIKGNVYNEGAPIQSMTIEWNDGGTPHDYVLTGLNIQSYQNYTFTHPTPFTSTTSDEYNITVKIKNINNNSVDINPANNIKTAYINTVQNNPPRNVLLEEATGTWCGWCPRGDVSIRYMDTLIKDYSFIAIAVHTQSNDPMTIPEYETGINCPGRPSCNVDRRPDMHEIDISKTLIKNYYDHRRTVATPVAVTQTVSYNTSTKAITINATANFKTKITGDLRFASILIEDSVTGTTSGYDQANGYAGGGSGPMGGYENLPSVVPAAQMVYNHVGRALIGGYYGVPSSLPASVNSTTPYNYNLTYTLPASLNPKNCRVVTLVLDAATGEVLNASKAPLWWPTAISSVNTNALELSLYPNPSIKQNLNIKFDVKDAEKYSLGIYTLDGKLIQSQDLGKLSGAQDIHILLSSSLSRGEYILMLSSPTSCTAKAFQHID